jgi:hypothetical protein
VCFSTGGIPRADGDLPAWAFRTLPTDVRVPGGVAIPLDDDGTFCVVAASDFRRVRGWHWYLLPPRPGKDNAPRVVGRPVGGREIGRLTVLHRLLLGTPPHLRVVHKNGDPLDFRRANLAECTIGEAVVRRLAMKGRRYKGVFKEKDSASWRASCAGPKGTRQVSWHPTEEEAARAYDEMARRRWGRWARLNFPEPEPAAIAG